MENIIIKDYIELGSSNLLIKIIVTHGNYIFKNVVLNYLIFNIYIYKDSKNVFC